MRTPTRRYTSRTAWPRLVGLSGLMVGLVAQAQAFQMQVGVKPRVMVIIDSSRSMQEPVSGIGPPTDISSIGGDFNCTGFSSPCTNKFCTAKEVICNTMPGYSTENGAVIGLASYYQYVINRVRTAETRCTYDVLLPSGLTRQFTSPNDYTGSWLTVPSVLAAKDLANAGDAFLPLRGTCGSNAAATYPITKLAVPAPVAGPVTDSLCYLANWQDTNQYSAWAPGTYPRTLGGGGFPAFCFGPPQMYVSPSPAIYATTNIRYVLPAGNSCGVPNPMTGPGGTPSPTAPEFTATSVTACVPNPTTAQVNCFSSPGAGGAGAISSARCTAGYPCHLYLQSEAQVGGRAWYGFHNTYAPLPADGSPPAAYNFSTRSGTLGATLALGPGNTVACNAGGYPFGGNTIGTWELVNNGTPLSTFGLVNVPGTVQGSGVIGLGVSPPPAGGTRLDETPGIAGATYNCLPNWPCDIRLAGQTYFFATGAYSYFSNDTPATTAVCDAANLNNWRWTASSTSGSFYTTRVPAAGTCVNTFTSNTNPVTQQPPPAGTWITSSGGASAGPAGCANVNDSRCTFTLVSQPNLNTGCSTLQLWNWAGASSGTVTYGAGCPNNGNTYTVTQNVCNPASTPVAPVTYITGVAAACPSNPTGIASGAPGYTFGTCGGVAACGSGPCDLTDRPSSTQTTWTTTIAPPGGPSWTRSALPAQPVGGVVFAGPANYPGVDCTVFGSGIANRPAVWPGDTNTLGPQLNGANNCGEGSSPCWQCAFQPVQYEWERKVCNYSATRTTLTPTTVPACRYTRRVYARQTCNANCTYSTVARRYDFNAPTVTECTYSSFATRLQTQTATFTYEYNTKGGELYGTWEKNIAGRSYCPAGGPYTNYSNDATYQTDCPSQIADCTGGIPGSVCKLRSGSGPGSNRYSNVSAAAFLVSTPNALWPNGRYFSIPENHTSVGRRECLAPGGWPQVGDAPATVQGYNLPGRFCSGTGRVEDHLLISDWHDPGTNSDLAAFTTAMNTAPDGAGPWDTVLWSKAGPVVPKGWGWSATGGTAVPLVQPTPSPIFVGIPQLEDPATMAAQAASIRNSMRRCIRPSIANGNIASGSTAWNTASSGICVADHADWQGPVGTLDYTPLYGSLSNAAKYMADLLGNDDDWQCRAYYLVLVTDGVESTPNHTMADLPGLVASFGGGAAGGRITAPNDATRQKHLDTFVIGFGAGVGAGALNAMAAAGADTSIGMPTSAFVATNAAALTTSLNIIFATITSGAASRAKPTVASDGSRVYAANFTKLGGTPEWVGELQAFAVRSDGSFDWMWNFSDKVRAQADAARSVTAATSACGDNSPVLGCPLGTSELPFTAPAAGALAGILQSEVGYPFPLSPDTIISFTRNTNLAELFSNGTSTRGSRVGPIVHSSPVVVGKSPYDATWGGTSAASRSAFSAFVSTTQTRPTRILVGSNEGLLRGVMENMGDVECVPGAGATDNPHDGMAPDGTLDDGHLACRNGREAWGFAPWDVLPRLWRQRNGNNLPSVDGLTSVADVCENVGSAEGCTATNWKTIAIGTEREGGRGLFALDITDPSSPTYPRYLWGFNDTNLGYSFSSPAIGRVQNGANARFVAIFGGGKSTGGAAQEGRSVYVVDALNGTLIREFQNIIVGAATINPPREIESRPAIHRIPNSAHLFAAYVSTSTGAILKLPFTQSESNDAPQSLPDQWAPEQFWYPYSVRSTEDVSGAPAQITRVVRIEPPMMPPVHSLIPPQFTPDDENSSGSGNDPAEDVFPMAAAQVKPLLNRPKIQPVLDPAQRLPDLFVGTGDIDDPDNPRPALQQFNYFVAIHDTNRRQHPSEDPGRTMWAHYFINPTEQVVSEPAVINGAVIMATYTPALCQPGDTTLYCFDPTNGALKNCLVDDGGPYPTTMNSVVKLGRVGIPSDLLVIGNNLYFTTSNEGLRRQTIQVAPPSGDIRSYRRIR